MLFRQDWLNAHLTISDPGVHNKNSVVKSCLIVLSCIVWVDIQQILEHEGQIWIIVIHTFCLQTNETNVFIAVQVTKWLKFLCTETHSMKNIITKNTVRDLTLVTRRYMKSIWHLVKKNN